MNKDEINQLIAETVKSYNQEYGVNLDPRMIQAIVENESNYNPNAISKTGAIGLGQIMPATAGGYGYTAEELKDPYVNIAVAVRHFGDLTKNIDDPLLAIAAYNAGQGAVAKYQGIPPYSETINYVKKVANSYNKLVDEVPLESSSLLEQKPIANKKDFITQVLNGIGDQIEKTGKDKVFAMRLADIAPVANVPLNEQGDTLYLRLLKKTYGDQNITIDPETSKLVIKDGTKTRSAPGQDLLPSVGRFAKNLGGGILGDVAGGALAGSRFGPYGALAGSAIGAGIGTGLMEFNNVDQSITKARSMGLIQKGDDGLIQKALGDATGAGLTAGLTGGALPVLKGGIAGLLEHNLAAVPAAIRTEGQSIAQAGADAMRRFGVNSPDMQRLKLQGRAENLSDNLINQYGGVAPGTAGSIAKESVDNFVGGVNSLSDARFTQASNNVEKKIAQGKKVDFYDISDLWNKFEKSFLSKPRGDQATAQSFLTDLKDNLNFTKFQTLDGQLPSKNVIGTGFVKKAKEISQIPSSVLGPNGQPILQTIEKDILENIEFSPTQITAKDYNQTKNFIKDALTKLDNPKYILDKQDKTLITQFLKEFERPFSNNADEALEMANNIGIDPSLVNSSKNPFILSKTKLPENASDFHLVRDGYGIRKQGFERLPLDARKVVNKETPTQIEEALFSGDSTIASQIRSVIDEVNPAAGKEFTNAVKSRLVNSASNPGTRKISQKAFIDNPEQFAVSEAEMKGIQSIGKKLEARTVKEAVLKQPGQQSEFFVKGNKLSKDLNTNDTVRNLLGSNIDSFQNEALDLAGKQSKLPANEGNSVADVLGILGRSAKSDSAIGTAIGTGAGALAGGFTGAGAGALAGAAVGAGIRPAARFGADALEMIRNVQPAAMGELVKGMTNNFSPDLSDEELQALLKSQTFSRGQSLLK